MKNCYFQVIHSTFTFNYLADTFIQSGVKMRRIIEATGRSREQHTSVMTRLSYSSTVHVARFIYIYIYIYIYI